MAATSNSNLRNLAAAVCLLIVVSSGAALFSIHRSSMDHERSLQRFDEFKDAINCARQTQVAFKTQVQEWKNLLLRGQDPKDYEEYLRRFTENESKVNTELGVLSDLIKKLDLDPAEVGQLQTEHATLGQAYREALKNYHQGDIPGILKVDKSVRGMDRKMNDQIDALVLEIDGKGDVFVQSFSDGTKKSEASYRNLLLGLSVLTMVVVFAFIFQAMRLRKTVG